MMTYELNWRIPDKVLQLRLWNGVSVDTFVAIDRDINTHLNQVNQRIMLLVDASDANVPPYEIERIRATQHYLQSQQLTRLILVSNKKINRLVMLLIFNLCRPSLQFVDDYEQANSIIRSLMA